MYLLYSKLYWNNLVITKITPQNTFVKYVYTMLHASIIGFKNLFSMYKYCIWQFKMAVCPLNCLLWNIELSQNIKQSVIYLLYIVKNNGCILSQIYATGTVQPFHYITKWTLYERALICKMVPTIKQLFVIGTYIFITITLLMDEVVENNFRYVHISKTICN